MPHAVDTGDEMPTRHDGDPEPSDAPRGEQPFRIGRFTILRRLGRGGMGVVYAAYDDKLDRKIALKLVYASPGDGSIGQARLLREAQALARLSHPNVVQIYEAGEHDQQVFLAMELVAGVTLRSWRRAAPRAWRDVLAVYLQAGRGLAAAHAAGLVHRDFKPDNALLAEDGRVRVLDFGLARALEGEHEDTSAHTNHPVMLDATDLSHSMTALGTLLGTPAYMSPEQLLRQPTDARSDQYSFCVALWEALYGTRPFAGRTLGELKSHVFAGPPRLPRSAMPAQLGRVLLRGLALRPERRHADMNALLAQLADDPAQRRRRKIYIAAAALGLAAAGAGSYALAVGDRSSGLVCDGHAALIGVWDPEARAAVEARFTATDLPYAAQSFAATATQLDAYALKLQRLYGAACEAGRRGLRTSRALALQTSCTERRRGALAALVGVLREADAAAVERASLAASRLPDIDACSDFAALSSDAEHAAARSPALAARIEAQHGSLAGMRAQLEAGHFPRAHDLALEIVAEAERLGDDALLAEALIARAAADLALGDYPATGAALHRGFALAEVARRDDLATDAAVRLVHLHGERENDLVRAETWAELAEAKARRSGDDGKQRGRTQLYLGAALAGAGRLQDAQPHLAEAMAIAEKYRERDPNFYLIALNVLATHEMDKGSLDVAESLMRRSLALREAALGPAHPNVSVARHNLGRVLYEKHEYGRAAEEFRRALEIRERSLGPEHLSTVATLNGLGAALADGDDITGGIEIFRRVLAIEERRRGSDHLELFAPLNNLGQTALGAGDFAAADNFLNRARALLERHAQQGSPDEALVLFNLGRLRLMTGAPDQAVELFASSLALRERTYGPEHVEVGFALALLAEAELAAGDHSAATEHAERAITVLRKRPIGTLELGRARLTLAKLRWTDPAHHAEARALARQAVTDLTSEHGDSDPLRDARVWLATHG